LIYAGVTEIPDVAAVGMFPVIITWSAVVMKLAQLNVAKLAKFKVPFTRDEALAPAIVKAIPPAVSIEAIIIGLINRFVNNTSVFAATFKSKASALDEETIQIQSLKMFDLNSCPDLTWSIVNTVLAALVTSVSEPNVQLSYVPESEPHKYLCSCC